MRTFLFSFLFGLLLTGGLAGQSVQPYAYYTFSDGADPGFDQTGNGFTLAPLSSANIGIEGQDSFLMIRQLSFQPMATNLNPATQDSSELSVEMRFRRGKFFRGGTLIRWAGRFSLEIYENRLRVDVGIQNDTTVVVNIPLEGINRSSSHWFLDGDWHHLAVTWNSKTGHLRVYMDGLNMRVFEAYRGPQGPLAVSQNLFLTGKGDAYQFYGDLDEVALFNTELSPEWVYQHYLDVEDSLRHYTFDTLWFAGTIPEALAQIDTVRNPLEYVKDYYDTSKVNALEVLRGYPGARYKPDHPLPPINWLSGGMAQLSLFDFTQNTVGRFADSLQNAVGQQVQKELMFNYNYSLTLGGLVPNQARPNRFTLPEEWVYWSTKLADSFPDYPRMIADFWSAVVPSDVDTAWASVDYISNKTLPGKFYPQDNNLIKLNSQWAWNMVDSLNDLKATLWRDRAASLFYLNNYYSHLQNRRLDVYMQNGEVLFPYGENSVAFTQDPEISTQLNSSPFNGNRDYYQAFKANAFRHYYQDTILLKIDSVNQVSGGSGLWNIWYNVGGWKVPSHFQYQTARDIHAPFKGFRRSTPYYYPQAVERWRYGRPVNTGLYAISQSRFFVLDSVGDALFHPFIAPGFDDDNSFISNESTMLRPGSFLGVTKILAAWGADAFFLFMKDQLQKWNGTWRIWKPVVTSYAQAVFSRYPDFYYNGGKLLLGDVGSAGGAQNLPATGFYYSFSTGDPSDLVAIRQDTVQDLFLISGTTQRYSNGTSAGKKEKNVCISLPAGINGSSWSGDSLTFNIRLQGSTYLFDPKDTTFFQLDGWHDWKEPSHWCKDFAFEAEVFDSATTGSYSIGTEQSALVKNHNFSDYTSYLKVENWGAGQAPVFQYQFLPRDASQEELYLWIRAKSQSGTSLKLGIGLNGTSLDTIQFSNTSMKWLPASGNPLLIDGFPLQALHALELTPLDSGMIIDKVLLTRGSVYPDSNGSGLSVSLVDDTLCLQVPYRPNAAVSGLYSGCVDWKWDFGDGTHVYTADTAWHLYQNPGTYKVTLEIREQCSGRYFVDSAFVTIVAPAVDAGRDTIICLGGSAQLLGAVDSGASAGWRSDTTLNNTAILNPLATPVEDGFYVLEASLNGCEAADSVFVVVVDSFETTLHLANDQAGTIQSIDGDTLKACFGSGIGLNVDNGFYFNWSPGTGLSDSTIKDPVANPADTTTYQVIVEDACRCFSDTLSVTIVPGPVMGIVTGDTCLTSGAALQLTASGGDVYTWLPNLNISDTAIFNPVVTPPSAQAYTVFIEDSLSGCSFRDTVNVGVFPTDTVRKNQLFQCAGDTIRLQVDAQGNAPSVSVFWSPGFGLVSPPTSYLPDVAPDSTLEYTAVMTGPLGCQVTDTVLVEFAPGGIITPDTLVCVNDLFQLRAFGRDSTSTFSWQPFSQLSGSGTAVASGMLGTPQVFSASVTITNTSAGGCGISDTVIVTALDSVEIFNVSDTLCLGDTLLVAGAGSGSLLWSPGRWVSDSVAASTVADPIGSGWLRLTSSGQCASTDSIFLRRDPDCCPNAPVVDTTLTLARMSDLTSHFQTITFNNLDWRIQDTLFVNTSASFSGCTFYLDSAAVIYVSGNSIFGTDNCLFKSHCESYLWEGIVVDGASASFLAGGDSIVQAVSGVHSIRQGVLGLDNTAFDYNIRGVLVDEAAGAVTADITRCRFMCSDTTAMLPPFTTADALVGIEARMVEEIQIGDRNHAAATNSFRQLRTGIFLDCASAEIYNNHFEDLYARMGGNGNFVPQTGYAVNASEHLSWKSFTIRIGDSTSTAGGNTVLDCPEGFRVDSVSTVYIEGNSIDSVDRVGITLLHNRDAELYVRNNEIEETMVGIQVGMMVDVTGRLSGNQIRCGTSPDSAHCGIRFDEVFADSDSLYSLGIDKNYMHLLGHGIYLNEVENLGVNENWLRMETYTDTLRYENVSAAFFMVDSEKNRIHDNDMKVDRMVLTNGNVDSTRTWMRGAYISWSPRTEFSCNVVENFTWGVTWNEFCEPTLMSLNTLDSASKRLHFYKNAIIGPQNTIGTPQFNVWRGSSGDMWDGYSTVSLGNLSTFYADKGAGQQHKPTNIGLDGRNSSALIPFSEQQQNYELAACGEIALIVVPQEPVQSYLTIVEDKDSAVVWEQTYDLQNKLWVLKGLTRSPELREEDSTFNAFYDQYSDVALYDIAQIQEQVRTGNYSGLFQVANAISPTHPMETNFKNLFVVRFDTVKAITENSQLSTLFSIASKCPDAEGTAVWGARALLASIGRFIWSESPCSESSSSKNSFSKTLEVPDSGFELELWPQPGSDIVFARVSRPEGENVKLNLFSMQGILLTSVDLNDQEEINLDVSNLPAGLYQVQATFSSGQLIGKKLWIAR